MAFYKKIKPAEDSRRYSYVEIDANDMRIFDRKCFATYAGPGELIVLLRDDDKKQVQ